MYKMSNEIAGTKDHNQFYWKEKLGFPDLPRLVLMITTPFAPLEP